MNDPASKRLRHYFNFRIRNAKLSYKGSRNVAIYAFSSGKFLNVRVYACVKDLTNIMSVYSIPRLHNRKLVQNLDLWAASHAKKVFKFVQEQRMVLVPISTKDIYKQYIYWAGKVESDKIYDL